MSAQEHAKIRVGILGATGLVGEHLIKILLQHPRAEITFLGSEHAAGQRLDQALPAFKKVGLPVLRKPSVEEAAEVCDVVFFAGKTSESLEWAPELLKRSVKVVDCGAEFRFKSVETYSRWYATQHTCPELLAEAVYGLPELYRDKLRTARLIANPGCYPTSAIIPLAPFVKDGLLDLASISIDSYSGVSGAGRTYSEKSRNLFVEANENIRAYATRGHRHRPEIEEHLSALAGRDVKVNFVPHLAPLYRGIHTTIFCKFAKPLDPQAVLKREYLGEPFVRIYESPDDVNLTSVAGTNFCDVGYALDHDRQTLILFVALDNLVKGASGQAVQAMNVAFGLDETTGLLWRSI